MVPPNALQTRLRRLAASGVLYFLSGMIAIAAAEPFIPQDDAQVLQRLAPSRADDRGSFRELRAKLRQNPENLALALLLAEHYIATGNALSDPRFYGYAQSVLEPWWDQQQPPAQILLIRSKLLQKQHDFNGALSDLERLIALQPRNAQAWLERSVLQRVQGDYQAAVQSCLPLLQLTQGIVGSICIANADSLSGRAQKNYQLLQQSLLGQPNSALEMRLWALTIMAEIGVQLGEYEQAEHDFKQGLALAEDDNYLLGAYADFLLEQDRPQEVVALLAGYENNDALLLLLTIAEKRLQLPAWQAHQALLAARIDAAQLRGGYAHLRTAARFALAVLEQPEQALQLAQSNWQNQREPADIRLLLSAALAAAQPAAAQVIREWLAETGLEDVLSRTLLDRIAAL